MLKQGDQIPDKIQLFDHDGKLRKLSDFKGKRSVYYVYPKNFTPGCVTIPNFLEIHPLPKGRVFFRLKDKIEEIIIKSQIFF